MYGQIINELNRFLNFISIPGTPINPDAFQGVFVKKLSNQNIIKDKRRINSGDIVSTVNQTHIDVTGRQGMLFFFEELNNTTTSIQNIDIDLYDNNLKYLHEIDHATFQTDTSGDTYFRRQSTTVPPRLMNWDLTLHSSAYKNMGIPATKCRLIFPIPKKPLPSFRNMHFKTTLLLC